MNTLRLVDLNHAGNKTFLPLIYHATEFLKLYPTLFVMWGDERELSYFSDQEWEKVCHVQVAIEAGIRLVRAPCHGTSLGVLTNNTTLFLLLMYPSTTRWPMQAVHAIAVQVLRQEGLKAELRNRNDIYIRCDDGLKKCAASLQLITNGWCLAGIFFTFDFEHQLAQQIYRLDTLKFQKKVIEFDSISDLICGIHEVKPGLKPLVFKNRLVSLVAQRLDLQLEPDILTLAEQSKLTALTSRYSTVSWTKDGIWPESSSTLNNI